MVVAVYASRAPTNPALATIRNPSHDRLNVPGARGAEGLVGNDEHGEAKGIRCKPLNATITVPRGPAQSEKPSRTSHSFEMAERTSSRIA
jgi:hypothetical protein